MRGAIRGIIQVNGFIKRKLSIMPLEKRLMFDASLPAIAGQVLWLDAADASTIIDADGDNAANGTGGNNDGFSGTVTKWIDKSTSGYDVTATAGQAPVYTTGALNGNAVLTFDGSNDKLTRAGASIPGDDFTTFVVFNRTINPTREAILEWGSGGARNALFINEANNGRMNYYINGGWVHYTSAYTAGTNTLASIVHNTGSINLYRDGVNEVSTTGTVRTGTSGIYIGDDSSGGDNLTGTIAEVIIYDRDLTADERHDVETYLASKWGLTIANTAPTVDTNTGITLDEATTLTITNANLSSSDADNTNSLLNYTITNAIDHGTLTNTNTAQILGLGDTFTQGDIDSGYITYTHDGTSTVSDSFIFDVTDGYGSVTNRTFAITVTPVGTLADVQGITGAVLHFDASDIDGDGNTANQPADGSSISKWDDTASVANDATASGTTQPLYDDNIFTYNTGGIVFDGVNDALLMGAHNEVNNTNYTEKSFAMTFRTGANVVSNQLIYEQGGTSNGISFGIWNGDIYAYTYHGGTGGTHYALNLGAASANTTYQLVAVYDSVTTNTWSANLNNGGFVSMAVVGPILAHSGAPGLGNENGATLHAVTHASTSGLDFGGAIGELWSWNHALTAGEISDVQDYLTDKWFDTPHTLSINTSLDVPEDGIVSITASYLETNDNEAPDTALTYTLTSLPAQGILKLGGIALNISDNFTQADVNNGLVTFNHDGTAAPGADTFGFAVSDGYNADITGTFTFNIIATPLTTPVLMVNDLITVNEGASITITDAYLDTDDGNTADTGITYTVTNLPSHGTVYLNAVALGVNDTFTQQDITNNLLTYTHDSSEIFTDSFNFTITDGTTTLGPVAFSVAVTPVNDQTPTNILLSNSAINENSANGTVIGTFTSTDGDFPGDAFTYSIVSDPDNKFQIVGSQLRVNGALNYEAQTSHSVTIRTNDGVHTYDKILTITVNDINDNPTDIALSNNSIAENSAVGTVIGTLSASDPDIPANSFTYSIIGDPDNKFQIVGNQLQVAGTLDFESTASHNVTIRVSDGNGGTYNEAFTINLTDANDTPVPAPGNPVVAQGGTLTFDLNALSASDQDGADNSLIYQIATLPSTGTIALNAVALGIGDTFTQQDIIDGKITYTHDNNASGASDSFTFTVSDGIATSALSTLTVNLSVVQTGDSAQTVNEGATSTLQAADLNYDIRWYDTDWSYRRTITIDSAMIDSDLTDYALLITESGFDADFWNNVKNDGSDIIIIDAAGNKLDRELVTIDTIGQTLQLYVRTDLSASADTQLTIYYGNAAAAVTNAATTWRSEYVGVWHFDDNFNDGDAADSSQAGNHGFAGNGFDNTNQAGGVTGNAAQFNDSEYLALNYAYTGNNTLSQISVSAWINTSINSGGQTDNWALIDFDRSEFFDVFIHGNGEVGFSTSGNGLTTDDFTSGITVNDGNWHYIAAVYDGTDKILYVDGVEVARDVNSHSGLNLGQSTRYGFIGDGSEASSFDSSRNNVYYNGLYDDIRMYEGAMDSALIAAEYRNHNNPSTFYSVGTHTDRLADTQYTLTDLPDNGSLFIDANTNGTLDVGEALALNATFTQYDIENNRLLYQHNGTETTSDAFSFTVQDNAGHQTATQSFAFTITPVNDSPIIATNAGATVNEGNSVTITTAMLNEGDPDDGGADLTYTASNYANGHITVSGVTQNTFTQADVNNGVVAFVHDGSETLSAAFDISLADSGADGSTPTTSTFNLTVTPVNDAPIINGWTLISSEDFEGGATGWADNTISNGGSYLTNHLGRFSNDGGVQSNAKTYTLSTNQDYTVIEFDFYRVDSWDSEQFKIFVNDIEIFSQAFSTGISSIADGSSGTVSWTASELNTIAANFTYNNWTDQMFHFTLTIQNGAASDVKLGFSSTTNQAVTDEAWGIDNVKVYEAQAGGVPGPFNVAENTANGQVVGYINSFDAENDTVSYSITGGTGTGAFAINAATGAITVSNSSLLDFETTPSFTLQITATDNGTPNLSDVETITINLIDKPENTAPAVAAAGPFTVVENSANGTAVGNISATDADGDTLTYSIVGGNTDNIFSINSSTGVISVGNNTYLNYEHDTQYTLTVRATDNGFGNLTHQRNIVIDISDVNEAPTFDAIQAVLSANSSVQYNAATGNFYQYVGTATNHAAATANATSQTLYGVGGHLATITSAAENTYVRALGAGSLWLGGTDSAVEGNWIWQGGGAENGVIFWLGNNTGSVQNGLYANWGGSEPNNSGGNEDGAVLLTNGLWNDANTAGNMAYVIEWEGTDVFAAATSTGPFNVNENVTGGTSVGFVQAEDVDAGDVLSYSITGGTGSALFQINSSTGEITVNNGAVLNFEVLNTYTLDMRVQDSAGLFDTRTVTINLNDINDIPANFVISNNTIVENEPIGTLIGTLSAFDEDGDALTYTMLDDAGGKFKLINGNEIVSDVDIDYEIFKNHSITLRVDDGNGGVVDKVFAIDVINLADDAFVPPSPDPTGPQNGNNTAPLKELGPPQTRLSLERLDDERLSESIIKAFLAGEMEQGYAFYGSDAFSQILREHTTYEIREWLDQQTDVQSTLLRPQDNAAMITDSQSPSMPTPHYTNLREALEFLSQMDTQESEPENSDTAQGASPYPDDGGNERRLPHTSLDNQFRDVMTYHQQRQADLRKALLAG